MTTLGNLALEPILPLEIECFIVKMVTEDMKFPLESRTGATYLNIQLTAKRFRDWIMLAIFRVLDTDTVMRYAKAAGPHFIDSVVPTYGTATTHLLCRVLTTEQSVALQRVLKYLPNIQDLAFWPFRESHCPAIELEASARPRRLSISFQGMTPEDILSPTYLNITHLDLLKIMPLELLAHFDNLLHLCFTDDGDWTDVVAKLTNSNSNSPPCRSLRFITAVYEDDEYQSMYNNERLVVILVENPIDVWLCGANGGMDSWEFSKRLIEARDRGYILDPKDRVYDILHFDVNVELSAEGSKWWLQLDSDMNR